MKSTLCIWLSVLSLTAAAGLYNHAAARPVPEPIVIDGILEPAWFTRSDVYNLGSADGTINNLIVEHYLTMLRLLYNRDYLYVSFVCSDDTPTATFTERDDPIYREDICEVIFLFPGSSELLELSVSPTGVLYDAAVRWNAQNRRDIDTGRDIAGLKSAVRLVALPGSPGRSVWTVELAIPWKALHGAPETPLRANFLRYKQLNNPELNRRFNVSGYLPQSLFPTGVRAWSSGPSGFRPLYAHP